MYCLLARHFRSTSSQNKIEKTQFRSLKLTTSIYCSDCKSLLKETCNSTMLIKRPCTLGLEIFKTLDNLNPNFMKDIFNSSSYSTHRKHGILYTVETHPSSYGDRYLRAAVGPHTCNALPENIKFTTSVIIFKDFIKNCFEPKCKCKLYL